MEKAETPSPPPELPTTRWRIVGLPDWPNRVSIELRVDTDARSVIEDIENAARLAGIELERELDEAEAA